VTESAFGGSLESGGQLCVDAFDMNHTSVTVKMFSHLFYFIKKFYRSVLSIRFEKKSASISCVIVQYTKRRL
jgi:hypothetical protein